MDIGKKGCMEMRKSYEIDMTHGPLLSRLLLFALPLICSGVLRLLFNAADIVVVGRFAGSHAMAAVGATSSLIDLLVNFYRHFGRCKCAGGALLRGKRL